MPLRILACWFPVNPHIVVWLIYQIYGITLVRVWINNRMPSKVRWNHLSIPKLQWLHRWLKFGEGQVFHPTLRDWCNYLSILGLKLIRVGKSVAGGVTITRNKGDKLGLKKLSRCILTQSCWSLDITQHHNHHITSFTELTHWGREKWPTFPRQHFQNACIPIKISLKFVPKGPVNNIPAMV